MKLEYEDCYNVYCRDVIDVVGDWGRPGRSGQKLNAAPPSTRRAAAQRALGTDAKNC